MPTSRVPQAGVDVAVGAAAAVGGTAAVVGRGALRVARPLADVVLNPPVVAHRYQPSAWLAALGRAGVRRREDLLAQVSDLVDAWLPLLVGEVLRRLDLASLVASYVDIDAIIAGVDLDAAVRRVDIDAIIAGVDLDAAVRRVDIDAIVAGVDLDAAVRRVDIEAVISRLDLTALVRDQVDLDQIIASVDLDAAAARLDVAAVIARVDLVGLTEEIINAIDLPEIIRESTGSVASETVRGVRMQSLAGDEAISRVMDRLLPRRDRRHNAVIVGPVVVPADPHDEEPDGSGAGPRTP